MLLKPQAERVAICRTTRLALQGPAPAAPVARSAPRSTRRVARPSAGRLCVRGAATLEPATLPAKAKTDLVLIPGGKGKATHLKKGDIIKIINTHGQQVIDFWAFSTADWGEEIMSMHHTRNVLQHPTPRAGDKLYTASLKPILTFLEDTGPGVHDSTAAACSYGLYVFYLGEEAAKEHDSCTNNLHTALGELGLKLTEDHRTNYYTPAPFNLWMNTADEPDHTGFVFVPPPPEQKAGDYCTFRAEQDCVAVMSACPWDVSDMNGPGGKPQDCHFQVFSA